MGDITESSATVALVNDDDEIVAGAVFTGYKWPNIWLSIAAEQMTPAFVAAIIHYPFVQLKCKRLSGLIASSNKISKRFAVHLGATLEGVMCDAAEYDDICIYGLMAKDAERWLKGASLKKLEAQYGRCT